MLIRCREIGGCAGGRGPSCSDIKLLHSKNTGVLGQEPGPRRSRETEFNVGGARRRKFTELGALRHGQERIPTKKVRKRGPRPGFGIAMGPPAGRSIKPLRGRRQAGARFRASPFGAKRPAGPAAPSKPQAAVQQWFPGPKNGPGPLSKVNNPEPDPISRP